MHQGMLLPVREQVTAVYVEVTLIAMMLIYILKILALTVSLVYQ